MRVHRGSTKELLILAFLASWCWAVFAENMCGSEFEDVPSRTLTAKIVFLGRVEGHTQHRYNHKNFDLYTVKVLRIYKGVFEAEVERGPEVVGSVSVGVFSKDKNKADCVGSRLKNGTEYVVFLNGSQGPHNSYHQISSFAEVASNKTVKAVMDFACAKCGRPSKIKIPQGHEIVKKEDESLKLDCRLSGKPTPKAKWFKDGEPINNSNHTQIKSTSRVLKLQINKLSHKDSGNYECQASNVLKTVQSSVLVLVKQPHRELCPDQNYCLNQGTCHIAHGINKKFCTCEKGFTGKRCQELNVNIGKFEVQPESNSSRSVILIILGCVVATSVFILLFYTFKRFRTHYNNSKPHMDSTYTRYSVTLLSEDRQSTLTTLRQATHHETGTQTQTEEREYTEVSLTRNAANRGTTLKPNGVGALLIDNERNMPKRTGSTASARARLNGCSATPEESNFRRIVPTGLPRNAGAASNESRQINEQLEPASVDDSTERTALNDSVDGELEQIVRPKCTVQDLSARRPSVDRKSDDARNSDYDNCFPNDDCNNKNGKVETVVASHHHEEHQLVNCVASETNSNGATSPTTDGVNSQNSPVDRTKCRSLYDSDPEATVV